ncbi:hypothetical protein SNE40_015054 [Patella caerulea]|uniref:DUF4549 domain-containing protein n=1 Tax=Patella caerulea TaxID=87958 RepID=A0AAN8JG49_PATCE
MELPTMYRVSGSEKVLDMERDLKKDLADLKSELEENEMVHGIPVKTISSVALPRDVDYFRQERKLIINRIFQVSEAQPLKCQADIMKEELLSCESSEYTTDSLPLLLHQHFTDRLQQLVQCKHQHMLRWKRFCEHTSTIESLYPLYHQRLNHIVTEYNDCRERAQRLSVAREAYLAGKDFGLPAVQTDDMLIYLRWLVCHLHSQKRIQQYLRILQWLHITHKLEICSPEKDDTEQVETSHAARIASRYQDDVLGLNSRPGSGTSRPSSSRSSLNTPPVPIPPPITTALLSTNPLPTSSMLYAAAAAGGGLASDEQSLNLPLHVSDFETLRPQLAFLLNIYGINFDLERIHTNADEMEMFAAVNRRFKYSFTKQENMKNFKMYDKLEAGLESWGADSQHVFKQDSNWLPFLTLKPEHDAHQEKQLTLLKQAGKIDPLLKVQTHFLFVNDFEKVQRTLRFHATSVREPPNIHPASVTTHRTPYNTSNVWKKIYSNPELYTQGDCDDEDIPDFDEKDVESVNLNNSRLKKKIKRSDSYDYKNTVQMLGLDDGDDNDGDTTTAPGAFLSFLHLRHLRIRDLQRTCLSVLNYFRSIERTLTINDGGLSHDAGTYQKTSAQGHRVKTESDGTQGGGGGIGSHAYLHNTPADYKVNESDFIEFSEVENHDDFYCIEEGRVHVQDQRGYYIMYDAALNDLEKLEKLLLLIATHYIDKDRDLRYVSKMKAKESVRLGAQQSVGDFDIPSYAHQEVDRFGVLLDLWSNEAAFLESKRELLDCYFEAYQHVFDRDERRSLGQVMTDVIHRRPRYDFSAPNFIKSYRTECIIVRHTASLVKNILDKQIEEEREYNQRVCRDGDDEYGLPYRIVPKQPIAVNLSRSSLKNVYMLEFHPTLSMACRIPEAIKFAVTEFLRIQMPESVTEKLLMEKKLLEVCQNEFTNLRNMGASYAPQVQKDLYSDVFAEDPLFICEIAQSLVTQQEQGGRRSTKEKQMAIINSYCRVMETITVRHRLMDSAWESEILAKVYRSQAKEMEFEDYHMFLRFVQFEFAMFKEDAGKPPPIFITALQEDDTSVDRYVPSHLYLAIHELDEGHVGRFSFRSRDGFLQILRPGGVKSMQVILKAQVVHKNALMAGVQQADICHPIKQTEFKSGRASPTETKSEKSSVTQMTSMSAGVPGGTLSSKHQTDSEGKKICPEAFISIQCEKAPSRDLMLNEFVNKKQQMGVQLKNPDELEKLKRRLISTFCDRFNLRVAQYSLRGQLIQYYQSILKLLEEFPNIRDTYFMIGEVNEKKPDVDDLEPDPRVFKSRPRQMLSSNGSTVLNIWFIPHHSEVLLMFKQLDDDLCTRALRHSLAVVSCMHDMLQYLCAHSRLGSSHARLGSHKLEFVSADWGGTEGIGCELREIQKQINNLPTPSDPQAVAEFLALRRDVMFLEFDTAVRHSMVDTFISTGNIPAFVATTNNTHHALPSLSNVQRPSLFNSQLPVPEPLEPRDSMARILFPWRTFLGKNGPFPVMFSQWDQIGYYIQLCLSGLKDVDRHVANGEILGVSLLMEDVLQLGNQDHLLIEESPLEVDSQLLKPVEPHLSRHGSLALSISRTSSISGKDLGLIQPKAILRNQQPMEAYRLLKTFLKLWKCLEVLKYDWGKRRLIRPAINSTCLFKEYSKLYRTELLIPVLQTIARRLGQSDIYDGLALHTDILAVPKGASEVEVKAKQMVRLLENLECHMIGEIRKRISREMSLALAERCREESNLPTDLWKKPVMKESFTTTRPYIAEHVAEELMNECEERDGTIIFKKDHFDKCLTKLYRNVITREKQCFESYSMYYENLLRVHHQLLYQREQEIKQIKDQLKSAQNGTMVDVQCQLAEEAHDLLMEVTALRAKVGEMREISLSQERNIRDRVKEEYDDLVHNLYDSLLKLRSKYDEFRIDSTAHFHELISETRGDSIARIGKLKTKFGAESKEDTLQVHLKRAEQLRELQHENHLLNTLVLKMKTMTLWRQNHSSNNFVKAVNQLRKNSEKSTLEYVEVKMLAEEEIVLLRQQLVSVKKALAATEKECNEVRQKLDRELKIKSEQAHTAMQKQRSKHQLEKVSQSNIEKLREELIDKDMRLKLLYEEQDRNTRMQQLAQEKTRKDVMNIKKQLINERMLKTDAFQTVDDLQTQLYDYETAVLRRSHSVMAIHSAQTGKSRSRATSAGPTRSIAPSSRGTNSTGMWPPSMIPPNRSLTPMADHGSNLNNLDKKIQRPKTVGGRLRSRIAEQLLNDLDPETQRSIIQLEELNYGRKDKTF